MNTKVLMMFCVFFALSACDNKDYGYNEKTAHNFLDVMERLNDSHERLTTKKFKPGIDSTDKRNSDWLDVIQKTAYIDGVIENTNELQRSEKTDAFHAQILKYFSAVKNNYYGTLKKYILAKDSVQQSTYYQQLVDIRKTLTEEENKSLEIQKKFLDDAGISHGK